MFTKMVKNFAKTSLNSNLSRGFSSYNKHLIVSKKKGNDLDVLKKYTEDLHKQVIKNPGFIKAESFWEYDKDNMTDINLVVFSSWKNHNDFDKWLESDNRKKVAKKYEKIKIVEKHKVINKINYNEIFLI